MKLIDGFMILAILVALILGLLIPLTHAEGIVIPNAPTIELDKVGFVYPEYHEATENVTINHNIKFDIPSGNTQIDVYKLIGKRLKTVGG